MSPKRKRSAEERYRAQQAIAASVWKNCAQHWWEMYAWKCKQAGSEPSRPWEMVCRHVDDSIEELLNRENP